MARLAGLRLRWSDWNRTEIGRVEGLGGPWFFKATGPDATVTPQREAFVTMLKSVRPQS